MALRILPALEEGIIHIPCSASFHFPNGFFYGKKVCDYMGLAV